MAQPPTYSRQFNFQNQQALTPASPIPAAQLDTELNAVKITLDAILSNLALIQRDDGAIANESVGADQLSTSVFTGFEPPTTWATATGYSVDDTVFESGVLYLCLEAHTSGTFATDLSAEKWVEIFDFGEYIAVGWSPKFAVATDGERRVLQLAGWIGGIGEVPSELAALEEQYVGASGYTATIGDAVDIRGGTGEGAVDSVFGRSGDVVAAADDYAASEVENDSSVTGDYVDDALNALKTLVDAAQPLDADLTALAALSATGIIARTGAATYANRAITAGTAMSVSDGDGVAGNPTINASMASEAQAKAGTSNSVLLSPLRGRQAARIDLVDLTDGATPALDASAGGVFRLAAEGNRTIAAPTSPVAGQKIIIRHKAVSAERTLALNTGTGGFRFGTDITALTATASGKVDYIGCVYDATDNKWDVVGYAKGYS